MKNIRYRWCVSIWLTGSAVALALIAPSAAAVTKHSSGSTSCTGSLASGTYQSVSVPSGQSCTMASGVMVVTNVAVSSGATLDDSGASIGGDVNATGAASISITGGTVTKNVIVSGTSGTVTISNTAIDHNLNTYRAVPGL